MSYLVELIRYLFSGITFYVKPRVTVSNAMNREISWPKIIAVTPILVLAQILLANFSIFVSMQSFRMPHFPISYQFILNIIIFVFASCLIFSMSKILSNTTSFKSVFQGMVLKFPIDIALSVLSIVIKYAFVGLLYVLPGDAGQTVGWTILIAITQAYKLIRNLDNLLISYGVWKISSIAVAIQIILVSKYALKTNVYVAIAATVAVAISCSAAAVLIFYTRYHGLYWKMAVGTLFS